MLLHELSLTGKISPPLFILLHHWSLREGTVNSFILIDLLHLLLVMRLLILCLVVNNVHQVNGCLSYSDKVPDGFYLIHGMDSYVWVVCTDLQENGRIPSVDTLKSVDPCIDSSLEVVLVDRRSDPGLRELQNIVHGISCSSITTTEVVDQLSKLVCNRMGWASLAFMAWPI